MNYIRTPLPKSFSVDNIISIHYFPYTKDFFFPGESHDFWELIIVDSGEVVVFDEQEILLKQGEGILHAPNKYHNIRSNNVFSNIIIITFDCSAKDLYRYAKKFTATTNVKFLAQLIINEAKQSLKDPLDIVIQEKLEFKEDLPFAAKQLILNALEMIIIEIMRDSKVPVIKKSQNRILADKILYILKNNISKKVTIDEIADSLGYCTTHIKNVFKSEYGTSIMQYFINLRIEEAKKLLSTREFLVTQVAETLGFDNVQYFCTQFKKKTNMTPFQYLSSVNGILK